VARFRTVSRRRLPAFRFELPQWFTFLRPCRAQADRQIGTIGLGAKRLFGHDAVAVVSRAPKEVGASE
jgi:hypothetical protein